MDIVARPANRKSVHTPSAAACSARPVAAVTLSHLSPSSTMPPPRADPTASCADTTNASAAVTPAMTRARMVAALQPRERKVGGVPPCEQGGGRWRGSICEGDWRG